MFVSYNQFHMYGFSDIANLLRSSPGTELYLYCGALNYEYWTAQRQKPAKLTWFHEQAFAFVNIIS